MLWKIAGIKTRPQQTSLGTQRGSVGLGVGPRNSLNEQEVDWLTQGLSGSVFKQSSKEPTLSLCEVELSCGNPTLFCLKRPYREQTAWSKLPAYCRHRLTNERTNGNTTANAYSESLRPLVSVAVEAPWAKCFTSRFLMPCRIIRRPFKQMANGSMLLKEETVNSGVENGSFCLIHDVLRIHTINYKTTGTSSSFAKTQRDI